LEIIIDLPIGFPINNIIPLTAAHHSIWRHLYDSMHAAQKPKSKLKFVTLDKASNMSMLW